MISSYLTLCLARPKAAYWLVKTLEIRENDADRKAEWRNRVASGEGEADVVRELPVTYAK